MKTSMCHQHCAWQMATSSMDSAATLMTAMGFIVASLSLPSTLRWFIGHPGYVSFCRRHVLRWSSFPEFSSSCLFSDSSITGYTWVPLFPRNPCGVNEHLFSVWHPSFWNMGCGSWCCCCQLCGEVKAIRRLPCKLNRWHFSLACPVVWSLSRAFLGGTVQTGHNRAP